MDKKMKLRIINKIGFFLIFIGFFMPIQCNLNGFQIAKTMETFGVPNILSISLYIIFISSCIGIFLLILLLMKIKFSTTYDWIITLATISLFVFFAYMNLKDQEESMFSFLFRFQSGAYIIFSGVIVSFVSLMIDPYDNVYDPSFYHSIIISSSGSFGYGINLINPTEELNLPSNLSPERKILILSKKMTVLTLREIILHSDLEIEEAESALKILVSKKLAEKEVDSNGKYIYLFDENIQRFCKNCKVELQKEWNICPFCSTPVIGLKK